MFVARRPAHPALQGLVDQLWSFEGSFEHRFERLLPSGEPQLLINLRADRMRYYDAPEVASRHDLSGVAVGGPYGSPCFIETTDQRAVVGVTFKAGAAGAILGLPMRELVDRHVSLEDLWGTAASHMRARVCEADSAATRFSVLEASLAARIEQGRAAREQAGALAEMARRLDAGEPVGHVADALGWTHRRLAAATRRSLGLDPKRYARVRRLQRALRFADDGRARGWAQIALDAGYFDQAHLCRDFRMLAGLAPRTYRPRAAGELNHVAVANFSKRAAMGES